MKITPQFLFAKGFNRNGQLSLEMLIFSAVTVILVSGFVLWAAALQNLSSRDLHKNQAFAIAEAGIEYYRWHLAHDKLDYYDGNGTSSAGPYVHSYYDKDGTLIGTFTLSIIPPVLGSRIVKVQSAGQLTSDLTVSKIIGVRFGVPSFAKYAWVLNDNVNFGTAAEVFGPIHSNQGIHFDGLAHNLVTSAQATYDDPDHSGAVEFGVHTHAAPTDPLPPAAVPSRPDIFLAGRQFPVPAVDFTGITQNLAQLKTDAQATGFYASSSGGFGYDVVLKTNGTFDLYKVNTLVAPPGGCVSTSTFSISTETLLQNTPLPTSGLMFFEDNIWVKGQINGARLTIGSGKFPDNPSTRTSINLTSNLRYTNIDGTDVIGLLAQNNVEVGLMASDTLRVDGALIAQNGKVFRPNFTSCGSNTLRTSFTSYGMLGTALRPAFYYGTSGFSSRIYIYDGNLLYGPPPSFPLTGDQYTQISWDEVK